MLKTREILVFLYNIETSEIRSRLIARLSFIGVAMISFLSWFLRAQIIKRHKLKPAIHLDNRYRLMRNEPMLDADGNETDQIGEDETAPPSPDEMEAIMKEKGDDYFLPKLKVTE